MKKKIFGIFLLAIFAVNAIFIGGCGKNSADDSKKSEITSEDSSNKLIIYTSMKENLVGGIVEGFKKKYPEIDVDYQSAGAGKLMAKISAERQSGHINADVIWTSEIPDFYQMKQEGILEKYQPTVFNEILNPFDDYDGSFTAARLGTLGIVINTDKISTPPTSWEDIATNPIYKDSFGIADPALSGTSYMSIALLEKEFGWDYFEKLHRNGAIKSRGSGRAIDDTASGELSACLGVDYITAGKIDKGAHLKMIYPKELIMVPSPVAIFKDSKNMDAAKKFIDYLLSKESQQKIADVGTIPVRTDVKMSEKYNLPTPEEALKIGIKIDYNETLKEKEELLNKFSELFK